jgi:hypothetical protein
LSVLVKTIAAVYRPVTAGFEGDFGFFTAFGAYNGVHLATGTAIRAPVLVGFPCLTACGAALGFVFKTFGLVKLLFLSAECEGSSAIGALDGLVLKSHWMTSSNKF